MANTTIERDFAIPEEFIRRRLKPELLPLFGISIHANPDDLLLAPVVIEGGSYGGGSVWAVTAHSGYEEDAGRLAAGDDQVIFGKLQISSGDNTRLEPQEVLREAEDWIRSSERTEYVPGSVATFSHIPEDMRAFFVGGLILARASSR